MKTQLLTVLAALLFFTGCDIFPTMCTTEVRSGIIVIVYDAVTGEPAADNALGIIRERDGTYVDTMYVRSIDSKGRVLSLVGADGRTGRYDVTIEKEGYTLWQWLGVVVGRDRCGVITEELEAQLEPVSSE